MLTMKHGTEVMGVTLECTKIDIPCSPGQLPHGANGTLMVAELCGPEGVHRVSSCMAEVHDCLMIYFLVGQFSSTLHSLYLGLVEVKRKVATAAAELYGQIAQKETTYAQYAAAVAHAQYSSSTYPGVFKDYSELAIQYGYCVLFASAFPLAPVICGIAMVIEVRSRAFQVCRRFRRPEYQSIAEIGTWNQVFRLLSLIAILTNAVLLVFVGTEETADAAALSLTGGTDVTQSQLLDYRCACCSELWTKNDLIQIAELATLN
jgi:hypothetical protein